MCCLLFFFFKQKTAYEMRISDWSSDVCSSDLLQGAAPAPGEGGAVHPQRKPELPRSRSQDGYGVGSCRAHDGELTCPIRDSTRSEENTSELQSLMRISYAVVCLKKKKNTTLNSIQYIQSRMPSSALQLTITNK